MTTYIRRVAEASFFMINRMNLQLYLYQAELDAVRPSDEPMRLSNAKVGPCYVWVVNMSQRTSQMCQTNIIYNCLYIYIWGFDLCLVMIMVSVILWQADLFWNIVWNSLSTSGAHWTFMDTCKNSPFFGSFMGDSINGGYPKAGWFIMENHKQKWMRTGGSPMT